MNKKVLIISSCKQLQFFGAVLFLFINSHLLKAQIHLEGGAEEFFLEDRISKVEVVEKIVSNKKKNSIYRDFKTKQNYKRIETKPVSIFFRGQADRLAAVQLLEKKSSQSIVIAHNAKVGIATQSNEGHFFFVVFAHVQYSFGVKLAIQNVYQMLASIRPPPYALTLAFRTIMIKNKHIIT